MITQNYTKRLLVLMALANSVICFAQDFTFKNYDWDKQDTKIQIPEQYLNEKEVVLNRTIKTEILVKNNAAVQYRLFHQQTYINSDDAIEKNNRLYIHVSQDEKILSNKVRVILKNNKIITLNQNDIKEEIDEERGIKRNYFAVNGLEKGAILEEIVVFEEQPQLNGKTFKMQSEIPIAKLNFELIYPEHLRFKTKCYNGLIEPTITTDTISKKEHLSLTEQNIPGLQDNQQNSNWDVKLKLLRYKLDENYVNGKRNLYNFKEFATGFYERLNPEQDSKTVKNLAEFCKSIPKSNDLQEQIWNIETKIKKNITYNRYLDYKETLADVLKAKQGNQMEILQLYVAIFKQFNIENNVVICSNRYEIPFDADFESYDNLDEFLFYFPTIKKYLTPTEIEYRIPYFPAVLGHNNGLFIKEKKYAGVSMGISEINFIEIPGTEYTHDNMEITIDFTKNISNPTITNKISFGGYSALNFQAIKDFSSAENYKTILEDISKSYISENKPISVNTQNDGVDFVGKKPFVLEVTYEGKDLIQKAGENYLFSIGQTIGKQMELYQENERTLPVELQYPHAYTRNIKILLPKNVTVKNLEQLKMNIEMFLNNKKEAAFTSEFKKAENEITIENTEYYNVINYPVEKFEEYKSVINAAADFNKIVLIINNNS